LKYLRILMAALSLMIITSACGNGLSADRFQGIQKKLFELKSYKCVAEIKIVSNKNSTRYLVNQLYLHPSKFKMEVIEPEFLKGILTVSNGNETRVSNPNLDTNNTYVSENLIKLTGNNLLITYFFSNYVNSEKSKMEIAGERYRLKTYIPSETDYMETEILSINREGYPESLEMFDKEGRLKIGIKYREFVMNPRLEENIFK